MFFYVIIVLKEGESVNAKEVIEKSRGSKGYTTIASKTAQERMTDNGWIMKTLKPSEDHEEVIDRYLNAGYKVKYYASASYVRGFYNYFIVYKR